MNEPSDDELLRLLGYCFMQGNRPEQAAVLYRAWVALQPVEVRGQKALAWAELSAGRPTVALEILDSIAGPGEPSAEVHLMRAQALAGLAQVEDARVSMRAFLAARRATLLETPG